MDTANLTLAQIIEKLDREEALAKLRLDAIRQRKRNALSLLNGEQELSLPESATSKTGKSTGLTKAVLSVLERKAKDLAISSSDVTDELLAQDFQPRGKQFSTSVYTTLIRLTQDKRGIVRAIKHTDGKRAFMYRNGHE